MAKADRAFTSIDRDKQREIATSEEARRKGGIARREQDVQPATPAGRVFPIAQRPTVRSAIVRAEEDAR
jgi:hypothetical protein